MWFNGNINIEYVHPSVRNDDEFITQAKNAEYDIFNHFTENGEVMLTGYDADVQEADNALVEAVERTIGEVVSFRLRNVSVSDGIQSIRQGARSITYSHTPSWDGFPAGWSSKLTPFDNRTKMYMI